MYRFVWPQNVRPVDVASFYEIYEAAWQVAAQLPETHAAHIAALKMLAAFHENLEPEPTIAPSPAVLAQTRCAGCA